MILRIVRCIPIFITKMFGKELKILMIQLNLGKRLKKLQRN